MNYSKIYASLIETARKRTVTGYTESHHIIPRCLGGDDSLTNLVDLTPEEHYLAHQLLVKIYPGNHSLVKAAIMMIPNRPSNKLYGWLRRRFAAVQSVSQAGAGNSQYGTRWIHNPALQISKKIPKNEANPSGWNNGRVLDWTSKLTQTYCLHCGREKDYKNKFCSTSCAAKFNSANKQTKFDLLLDKMLDEYTNGKAISKCLIDNNLCGTGTNFVRLKEIIQNRGLV